VTDKSLCFSWLEGPRKITDFVTGARRLFAPLLGQNIPHRVNAAILRFEVGAHHQLADQPVLNIIRPASSSSAPAIISGPCS